MAAGSMTKANQAILIAVEKGYYFTPDGQITGPSGQVLKGSIAHRCGVSYQTFAVRIPDDIATKPRETAHPDVHRFIAYCLFGDVAFDPERRVRHLDGNSLNNRPTNLAMGTQHDAQMDRPVERRVAHAQKAANARKLVTDAQAVEIRELKSMGVRTKYLAEQFGCSAPTICDIAAGRIYRRAEGDS